MSNVIKPTFYVPLEDRKTIEFRAIEIKQPPMEAERVLGPDEETLRLKETILKDAEQFAESLIAQANQDAEQIRAQARDEIEAWWAERRAADEAERELARQDGYEAGFAEAKEHAIAAVQEQYARTVREAEEALRHAMRLKREIIAEAEPFLIELSCAIAEKLIGRQLSLEPDWIADMIKRQLARKREKGLITLCVSPARFPFVQEWRNELKLSLDSQTDLEVLPDATVTDDGCVVRSELGSIDARIDTQLTEIKAALVELSLKSREDDPHE